MSELQKMQEYLRRLKDFGISKNDFHRKQQRIAHQLGKDNSSGEIYWAILNELTRKIGDEPFLASRLFFFG
jgi:hypothetical protein